MGIHVLDELVSRRVWAVISVAVGSLLLASCSSNTSRFDFPTFGLAKSDNGQPSGMTLNGSAPLAQSNGDHYMSGRSNIAELDADRNPDLAAGGAQTANQRNSYMPPQTAVPEVRDARYSVERQPLDGNAGYQRTAAAAAPGDSRQQPPMRPISDQQQRSFLPEEPAGYVYSQPQPGAEPQKPMRQASLSRDDARSAAPVRASSRRPSAPAAAASESTLVVENGQVTVQPGDTLHALSQRVGATVPQMMELNGLTDSNLVAGQKLRVPSAATARTLTTAAKASGDRPARAPAHAAASETYTVKPGDDFQSIASSVGVEAAELADLNGVTDPASIRPGEVLILPAHAAPAAAETSGTTVVSRTAAAEPATADDGQPEQKIHKVKTVKMASLPKSEPADTTVTDTPETAPGEVAETEQAVAPKAKSGGKISGFRWPVEGRIIEKFGSRGDGTNNDGINLAVPNGTKVKAAEDGIVAYVGNELKDYGNLVLIRHADGWVSAYGHNAEILVQRGDQVKRGQDIARAGNSGAVEQPQVHFELRQGSKPVDPTKYMAGS
jgi:murein DD-endopeptidase MepM/ murein hydrolase activator NlpD